MHQHIHRFFAFFVFVMAMSQATSVHAQEFLDHKITAKYNETTLIQILLDLEKKEQLKIFYDPALLPYYPVSHTFEQAKLIEIFTEVLKPHGLVFFYVGSNKIVVCRSFENNKAYAINLMQRWEKGDIVLPEFLRPFQQQLAYGDAANAMVGKLLFTAQVVDEQSREPLQGVTIRSAAFAQPMTTDAVGRVEIRLDAGQYKLSCELLGYRKTEVQLDLFAAGNGEILLQIQPSALQEIVIEGNQGANKVKSTTAGLEVLSTRAIKEVPAFMGEADVIKSLSILPGVSSVGEGATGFNVRGGNADQNLVIQDGMPFLNTAHAMGFFSVFNPDMVRTTNLFKGHIPAEYGGRISSVLDVSMRDGNFQQWHGAGGVGLISGKAFLEGPLWKNKISIIGGARASYSDWLLKRANQTAVKQSSTNFDDASVKISARIGNSGSVTASAQRSYDFFRYAAQFGYEWKTESAAINWRQTWQNKYMTRFTWASGRYSSNYFVPKGVAAFNLSNGVVYHSATFHTAHVAIKNHQPVAGIQWNLTNTLNEQFGQYGETSTVSSRSVPKDRGAEWAAYVSDTWEISKKLTVNAGLRYSFFSALGEKTLYKYASDAPRSVESIIDSTEYGKGDVVKTFGGLEPRISVSYQLSDKQSVKLSYNRMRQYLHQITNTTSATPADTWQVSNPYIGPQVGDNFSIGYFQNTDERRWEYSTEFFYKKATGIQVYKDFSVLLLNEHLETELLNGLNRSYGSEVSIRKNKGVWTGTVAYTYSRTFQRALSDLPAENVNQGEWFRANFDQPHSLNVTAKWAQKPTSYFTFNLVYKTGRPVTVPTYGYSTAGTVIPYFPLRNNQRLGDYHRLDIAYTFDTNRSKISGIKSTFTIGCYNIYARQNPFSVFFQRDQFSVVRSYELSIIGTAIPAVNLTFSW